MIHDIVLIVFSIGLFVMTLLWADARMKLNGSVFRRQAPSVPGKVWAQVNIDGKPFRITSMNYDHGDITVTLLDEASVNRHYRVH